jgi:hypothetical protein
MQRQFLSNKETHMDKHSIQSIVLPSIYEKRVGDGKYLDEESRGTIDKKYQNQNDLLQRSASQNFYLNASQAY